MSNLPSSTNEAPAKTEQARSAGRGGAAMLAANLYFIVTGLVQQALLPKAIGLADYGALSRVLAVSNVFNNVIVSSSTQGVSRTVAAAGDANERKALRATLRVHLLLAVIAAVLLGGAAPFVAYFQHAPDVLAPLLVMTGVLFVYGIYAPLFGYLNGREQFMRQASLNIAAATLRTAALLGVGWFFARRASGVAALLNTTGGVLGATLGTVGAATCVFLIAVRWTGTGTAGAGAGVPTMRGYLGLIVPIMVAQFFTNNLMQADIFMLGRYLSLSSVSMPADALGGVTPTQAANEWVAVYRACQLFAFLPYQMLFSVTQVLFPMLARAKAENGGAQVPALVARGSRIGAIVCGMLVCVVLVLPGSLIKFAYGPEVAARGADTLRLLAVAQAVFAMVSLSTTVLISLGRERSALLVTAVALALLAAACSVIIPMAPFGAKQLMATATATTIAMCLALVVGVFTVRRVAGAFIPWKTALRVALLVAAAYFAGGHTPTLGKLVTPLAAGVVVALYLVGLVVTGELGKTDLSLILSVAARRRGTKA